MRKKPAKKLVLCTYLMPSNFTVAVENHDARKRKNLEKGSRKTEVHNTLLQRVFYNVKSG